MERNGSEVAFMNEDIRVGGGIINEGRESH